MEMKKREIRSVDLARKADVRTSFLYDVISGKSANPSTVKLARVADALGVSLGYLVDGRESPHISQASHGASSSDPVGIQRLMVDVSGASSELIAYHHSGERYFFRREWIREHLGVAPEDLRMLHVRGDSMEPTLCHNDVILIDTTKKTPSPPGVFVLFDGFGLLPKRLEYVGNSMQHIRIISDNPQYTSYERSAAEVLIIGRVVWFAREM